MGEVKKATTIDQQIEILKERNLIISDKNRAKEILSSINYYNFTGYLFTYKSNDGKYHDITFDDAYRIYLCDKRIRSIILYAIEIIEHNLKTKISYNMAHILGELSYTDSANFTNAQEHAKLMDHFKQSIQRNRKVLFVKHHLKKYQGSFPVWVAIELFTFGMVWNCFKYLKNPIRKKIASDFGTGAVYLESWIECVSYLRNMCAHYMRLYRLNIQKTPKQSKRHGTFTASNRVYDILYTMRFLMLSNDEWENYIIPQLSAIFDQYADVVSPIDYGFPSDWKTIIG